MVRISCNQDLTIINKSAEAPIPIHGLIDPVPIHWVNHWDENHWAFLKWLLCGYKCLDKCRQRSVLLYYTTAFLDISMVENKKFFPLKELKKSYEEM